MRRRRTSPHPVLIVSLGVMLAAAALLAAVNADAQVPIEIEPIDDIDGDPAFDL